MNAQGKGFRKLAMPVQLAIAVGAVVLLAAVGYFGLVSHQQKKAKDAEQQVLVYEQQIQDLTSQSRSAADQSKIMVADAFRLTKAMPDSPDVGEIILELNDLARRAGIRFDSISPEATVVQSGYEVQPIGVVFQGRFLELSEFLLQLKSLVLIRNQQLLATGRLFTVDKITFTQGDGGFPNISAALTIDAYIYTGAALPTTTTSTTSTEQTATISSAS